MYKISVAEPPPTSTAVFNQDETRVDAKDQVSKCLRAQCL
jgi:hypothetical protein